VETEDKEDSHRFTGKRWLRIMKNVIEVKELTKDYNGLTAVDHINFEVEEGEVFGFLGPNGAGTPQHRQDDLSHRP